MYTPKTIRYILPILVLFIIHSGYSQQIQQAAYTLAQTNLEIENLNIQIDKANERILVLQQQQQSNNGIDNATPIANAQQSILNLQAERKKWEDIKFSIEVVQNNNLQVEGAKDPSQIVPAVPITIKQADFDALPEPKKQNILSHPELYVIEE